MNRCENCKKFINQKRKYCCEKCRNAQRYKKSYEYINSLKSRGCVKCGYDKYMGALHFHHKGKDKLFKISTLVSKKYSQVKIDCELKKCKLLCANCHAELHSKEKK